jgi:hypothetical protein
MSTPVRPLYPPCGACPMRTRSEYRYAPLPASLRTCRHIRMPAFVAVRLTHVARTARAAHSLLRGAPARTSRYARSHGSCSPRPVTVRQGITTRWIRGRSESRDNDHRAFSGHQRVSRVDTRSRCAVPATEAADIREPRFESVAFAWSRPLFVVRLLAAGSDACRDGAVSTTR